MSSRLLKKKKKLPFDSRGGVIVQAKHLLNSKQYLGLTAQSKVLLTLIHVHWKNDEPVGFGIREAMAKIPCAKGTAQRAFDQLHEKGFITMVDESLFSSRSQCRTRTWKLNWLPYMDEKPTHEWEK